MRLFLQQQPAAGEAPKFVQLILEQDLLGGWFLVKESGHTGGRSQLKREQFLQHEAAIIAFEKDRDNYVKRGFQIMFIQGVVAP